jgi:putative transcriptional regulator
MSIVVKLDDMLHDRRMTLTDLADRVGMTLANLSILKTGKARAIRFSTLDAICEALACQPGDILRFEKSLPRRSDDGANPDAERVPPPLARKQKAS